MSTKVQFTNVGRGKDSWIAEFPTLDNDLLYCSVKRNSSLMSQDIDFHVDPDSNLGKVIVGGFRVCGEFKVISEDTTK